MSSRKFASLEPEERKQVIDGIYQQLAPLMTKAVNAYLKEIEPKMRETVRSEVGKFAVTEKLATAFLDGMVREAVERAAGYFRPRWIMRAFFRG
jgi:DNA-directed RNA polymerase subunit F